MFPFWDLASYFSCLRLVFYASSEDGYQYGLRVDTLGHRSL